MNFIKSNYFIFLMPQNSNPFIIKFKPKKEKYFLYDTFETFKLIPLSVYDVEVEKELFTYEKLTFIDLPFKIIGINYEYLPGDRVQFIILNKKKCEFNLNFILVDENHFVRFEKSYNFKNNTNYITDSFTLPYPSNYKLFIFLNNEFLFYKKINVKDLKNVLNFNLISQKKDKLLFQLKDVNKLKTEEIELNKYSAKNRKTQYSLINNERNIRYEILYVPVKKFYYEIDKVRILSKFAIKNENFNPAGILKVISTIKEMNELDEIKFIKELFKDSPEIAFTLTEILFDFNLLFNIPPEDMREILDKIEVSTLAVAFKALPHEKIEYIKYHISQNRFNQIESLMNNISIINSTEIESAQKSISDYIKAYFKQKYGIKIVITQNEERLKIQTIDKKLVCNPENKCYLFIPKFYFNDKYILEFVLPDKKVSQIFFDYKNGKESLLFYENIIYEDEKVAEIIAVDYDYIYLKFNFDFDIVQVVLFDNQNNLFSIYETREIYNDEVIKIKHNLNKELRLIIGGVTKELKKLFENDIYLEIFNNKIENEPVNEIVFKNDIKVRYSNFYQDFVTIEKNDFEFNIRDFPKFEHYFIITERNSEFSILENIKHSFPAIFAEFISEDEKEGVLKIYNPLKKEFSYTIEVDSPANIEKNASTKEYETFYYLKFENYFKLKISSQFGKSIFFTNKEDIIPSKIKININEGLYEELSQIKMWLFNLKEYNLFHFILLLKIAFLEENKNLIDLIFQNVLINYFKFFKIKEKDLENVAKILNKLRVFYLIEPKLTEIINNLLSFFQSHRKKDFNLWPFGKKYCKNLNKFKKYVFKKLKNWEQLNFYEKLYFYRAGYFLNRNKLKKINLGSGEILKVDYLEILDIFIDLIIIQRYYDKKTEK